MTDGITSKAIRVNGIRMHYREAGESGAPAMILLHGWPQTSYAWRKMMGPLGRRFRVVAPDLRGMGHSDKPATGYDMRTVATDIRELATALGLERPYVVGTDWGGLVARRFALDFPGLARRYAIVDIVPHEQIFQNLTVDYAKGAWHYWFNAFGDLPEHLVAKDVEGFLRAFFAPKDHNPADMEEGLPEYVRAYSAPGALRGGFAYYKAMFAENRTLDRESAGKRIAEPMLCVWGNSGGMGGPFDVLAMWQREADDVRGHGLDDCGHYIAEEAPGRLVDALLAFEP